MRANLRQSRSSRLLAAGVIALGVVLCTATSSLATDGDAFARHFNLPRDPDPVLKEILAAPEYRDSPLLSLIDRARRWFDRAMESLRRAIFGLFPDFGPVSPHPTPVRVILLCLLVGLVSVLGFLAVRGALRYYQRRKDAAADIQPEDERPGIITAAAAWEKAIALADKGNYREAVILLFRYLLLRLDEQGRLRFHPGKTNGEIVRSIGPDKTLREAFREIVPFFNRLRYGDAKCDEGQYRRFVDICRAVTGVDSAK